MHTPSAISVSRLSIADPRRFDGCGVYYSATDMEAGPCLGEEVIVVGGGNSAGQAAVFLANTMTHPLIRSYEPGETWGWCYVDEFMIDPMPGHMASPRPHVAPPALNADALTPGSHWACATCGDRHTASRTRSLPTNCVRKHDPVPDSFQSFRSNPPQSAANDSHRLQLAVQLTSRSGTQLRSEVDSRMGLVRRERIVPIPFLSHQTGVRIPVALPALTRPRREMFVGSHQAGLDFLEFSELRDCPLQK